MKKIFLLSILLTGLLSTVLAQTVTVTVSGVVLRDSTHAPVPNHQVIIQADSNANNFTFYATRMTSSTGHYDCVIHNVPTGNGGVTFSVETKDCDSTLLVQYFIGTNTPDTINFLICNGNANNCQAEFTYSTDTTPPGTTVYFYDNSTPAVHIHQWSWSFGDPASGLDNISSVQNPIHVYSAPGTYTPCLTIWTDSNTCTSTVCHELHIGQNTECQAAYTYYADSTNLLHVHFYDASTPQNLITSRIWTFGDGDTALTFDPWHTYQHSGHYEVCIYIATSTGCTSHYCDSIYVGSNANNCESWFTYTSDFLTFTFEGHTHSIYPTTYTWNFGDGSPTLTGHVVTHTYATQGTYTVTLHTIDSVGCEYTRTQSIYAHGSVDLNGSVYLSNSLYVDHGLIELIRLDSAGYVTVVDSHEFGDSSGMYWFGGVLPGHYYLRASLLPSSAYYGQYVPTYYENAVNWNTAHLIELGSPSNPYNIHMVHVMNYNSGSGNIHGMINQGGKMSATGTPAANVEVLLLDVSSQVLAFTQTDTSGVFSFPNMAFGTYKIYPEMIEKTTTPATVTLDNTYTNVNLIFTIQGNSILGILDGSQQLNFEISGIYPNPVSDFANLSIRTGHSADIHLILYSITGIPVRENQFSLHAGTNKVSITTSGLTKGVYYVKVEKDDGVVIVKKFILDK